MLSTIYASNKMSDDLKSESMWLCKKPDEITGLFQHSISWRKCQCSVPLAYYLVLGACGVQERDVKIKGTAANSVAFASVLMCRLRSPKALALHYRISIVLSKLTTKSLFG